MKKRTKKILGLSLATLAPLTIIGGVTLSLALSKADDNYITEWHQYDLASSMLDSNTFKVSGDFQTEPLTGWSLISGYDVRSTGIIIDVGNKVFEDKHTLNFFLENNPGKLNKSADNKVLMINSQYSTKSEPHAAKRGYRSNEFTLKSNSYYKIAIDASTTMDGYDKVLEAKGSIYLNGIIDEDGNSIKVAYEGFSGNWQTYEFFIATGAQDQKVTLDLYLGASNTEGSYGAVFYDEIQIEQYSHNAFINDAVNNYGYKFEDYLNANDSKTKFLVDELKNESSIVMQREDYKNANLDFEDEVELNWLTSQWRKTDTKYANTHARIYDVEDGRVRFEEDTDYKFVGNDLTYGNKQALVLYTDKGTSGKVTVENSTPITVNAHEVYKINVKAKVSSLESGAFYVNLVEGNKILSTYNLKEDDIGGLKTGSTSGFSSNATDKDVVNNYSDITIYVVGRNFYDSEVTLQLALGNDSAEASGCVFIDSITIDYATSSEASSANNVLYLQGSDSVTYPNMTNAYFNDVEVEGKEFSYPLKAKNWTLEQPTLDKNNVVAGVIYLYDQPTYEKMYDVKVANKNGDMVDKYAWATSYPEAPNNMVDGPNNVYMLCNYDNSAYQSLKSESYTLNANSYYKLSFSYQTALSFDTAITLEIVDDNGIVLYNKQMPSSLGVWNNDVDIEFHTALTTSHKISVVIHLGTEEEGMQGIVYLDNFDISSSTQEKFDSAIEKIDLTNYMLNLDPDGTIANSRVITKSSAYEFSNNAEANATTGGVINGKDNQYEVTYEDKNILAIVSSKQSSGTLTSVFPFSLTSGQYYKLTFSLFTRLYEREGVEKEEGHECNYGVTIGLTNYALAEKLQSDEKWTDYTIYINASNASESKLQFALNVDEHYTGCAFLTNVDFTEATEQEYNNAVESENFEKSVFTSSYVQTEEQEEPTEPDVDDTEDDNSADANNLWLIIPSLITALAVLIGIIGFAFRHVKIKKIEKVREEEYSRRVSLDQERITLTAKAEQDRQAGEIKANIAKMQEQKQILEDEHKLATKDARLSGKGKITKETEHEFKTYASRLTRLEQKLEILNEQLAKVESTEYLETLKRKATAEETARQKQAMRKAEAESKDKLKQNKKDSK